MAHRYGWEIKRHPFIHSPLSSPYLKAKGVGICEGQNEEGHETFRIVLDSERYRRMIYLATVLEAVQRKNLEEACCSYLVNEKREKRESERANENEMRGESLSFRSFPKRATMGGLRQAKESVENSHVSQAAACLASTTSSSFTSL